MGKINVDFAQCTGCRMCEIWCSLKKEGVVNPKKSRIRVTLIGLPEIPVPVTCQQCNSAPCARVCVSNAIEKNETTGALIVDKSLCTGCGDCVEACPFGAIFIHPVENIAVKCDLCGGEPECVKHCVRGFLSCDCEAPKVEKPTINSTSNQKRVKFAQKISVKYKGEKKNP